MGSGVLLLGSYNTTPYAPIKGRGLTGSKPSSISPEPSPLTRMNTKKMQQEIKKIKRGIAMAIPDERESTSTMPVSEEAEKAIAFQKKRLQYYIDKEVAKIPDMLVKKLKGKGKGKTKPKTKRKRK